MDIKNELLKMGDPGYKAFHKNLIPNISEERIIGIRTPILRKYAKDIFKNGDHSVFLDDLPHFYYEENNLHAFLIEQIKDYDKAIYETEKFLPYIDNWATCDSFLPKVFEKNKDKLKDRIYKWIDTKKTYSVRYGIGLLMKLYLDEDFTKEDMDRVAKVKSDEYYVNMMIAWYFQTALVKQYQHAIGYIKDRKLGKFVHNKAIQKAIESLCTDDDTKAYLRTLKIK